MGPMSTLRSPPSHQMTRERGFHLATASVPSPVDLAGDLLSRSP